MINMSVNGYVYVMHIPNNKSLCKVGMTTRTPQERLVELNNQEYFGFSNWKVFGAFQTPTPKDCERQAHRILSSSLIRIGGNATGGEQEVFKIAPKDALAKISPVVAPEEPSEEEIAQERALYLDGLARRKKQHDEQARRHRLERAESTARILKDAATAKRLVEVLSVGEKLREAAERATRQREEKEVEAKRQRDENEAIEAHRLNIIERARVRLAEKNKRKAGNIIQRAQLKQKERREVQAREGQKAALKKKARAKRALIDMKNANVKSHNELRVIMYAVTACVAYWCGVICLSISGTVWDYSEPYYISVIFAGMACGLAGFIMPERKPRLANP